jgi:peptidyl-prolyl cis-trans isomerase B (cyclophilin B)
MSLLLCFESLIFAQQKKRDAQPSKPEAEIKAESEEVEPFKDTPVDQLRKDVLLRTSLGDITVTMEPDFAPEHVRNFLRLVQAGWYDRTAFHRVIPGFVVQGGAGGTRAGDAPHPADRWVRRLKGEFSQVLHTRGALSMARGDDPDSAQTSFFIVLGPAPHLDRKYSVFGKVVDGFDTLERIEKVACDGETPRERVELIEAVIKP